MKTILFTGFPGFIGMRLLPRLVELQPGTRVACLVQEKFLDAARRALESITMDREVTRLRDSLGTKFAESVYYGFWFAPEFEILRSMIDQTQETVSGDVRLKLYKGNVIITGRKSPNSLYRERVVTFEDDAGAYDQHDAEGFIKLQALRLRLRKME